MIPLHAVTDETKVKGIIASIEANGWVGVPLVFVGDGELITGAHRFEAMRRLGLEGEIPVIELAEIFAEAGLDLDEIAAEYDNPNVDESYDDFQYMVNHELPYEILNRYGIDIH